MNRRDVLASAGIALCAGLAGCPTTRDADTSGQTPSGRPEATGTPTAEASDTESETATSTPTGRAPSVETGDVPWSPPTSPPTSPASGTWPLLRYDAGGTRTAPADTAPESGPLERRWETDLEGSTTGPPLAGTDGLYVTSRIEEGAPQTALARLVPASGDVVWETVRPGSTHSPPVLAGDEFLVALGTGTVTAFATDDGTSRTITIPAARSHQELLGAGGLLYVTDRDDTLHALDTASGDWSVRFDTGAIGVGAPVAGDVQEWTVEGVAVDEARVYVATAAHYNDELPPDLGKVFALDPDAGAIAWTTRLAPETPSDPTPARHVAVRDGSVYVTSDRRVWRLDHADGTHEWATPDLDTDLWASQLAVTHAMAYVGTAESVVALDATTGETRWTRDVQRPLGMAATDGTLYLASVPAGDTSATLRALDADGTTIWRQTVEGADGTLALAHGRLYAGTDDGRVLAFA